MKKRKKIAVTLVIAVIVLLAVVVMFNQQTTGNATFTQGAFYGPLDKFSVYTNCVYLTEDDGWNVFAKERIQFFNKLGGQMEEAEDHCDIDYRTVREYHCEDGYRKSRPVKCPIQMHCDNGVCVGD